MFGGGGGWPGGECCCGCPSIVCRMEGRLMGAFEAVGDWRYDSP